MNEYRIHLNLTTTVAILVLGIAVSAIVSTIVAAKAYKVRGEQLTRSEKTIVVKGSARKRIRSDRAVWQIRVEGESKQIQDAFKILDSGIQRVRAFLEESHKFKPDEIGLGAIDTDVHYVIDPNGQPTRNVASYTLFRTFFVTSGDVERVMHAAGQVTELIQEGVLVISQSPAYYYSDPAALKVELMGLASKDARGRAEEIARSAGCKLGQVRAAYMGVLQITRPYSTDVSSEGIYDTSTIEKDAQAVVTVTFQILDE